MPQGEITEAGLRNCIRVGVQYIEAWLRGSGCVPLYNLMEDAATAEICRAQLWQWIHNNAHLQDGRKIDVTICDRMIDEELAKAKQAGDAARYAAYEKSAQLMRDLIRSPQFVEFLTVPAYQKILSEGN